jgi:predicted pyridoxine 5'-phosphate oxidase superfamily flavin-nucleotide-binding protein
MSNGYGRIAFTPTVQAEQERHGSAAFYAKRLVPPSKEAPDPLSDEVVDYLSHRDSFYLASVSETGWPYVQFRGGPTGFLRALSDTTIGWADYRGNLQYVSTGNVHHEERVALIVMDYAARRRLKIFGRAAVHEAGEVPDLADRVTSPDDDSVVERIVVVQVAAYDWNCPQHITPRYTLDEIREHTANLWRRLDDLEEENARLRRQDTSCLA